MPFLAMQLKMPLSLLYLYLLSSNFVYRMHNPLLRRHIFPCFSRLAILCLGAFNYGIINCNIAKLTGTAPSRDIFFIYLIIINLT